MALTAALARAPIGATTSIRLTVRSRHVTGAGFDSMVKLEHAGAAFADRARFVCMNTWSAKARAADPYSA